MTTTTPKTKKEIQKSFDMALKGIEVSKPTFKIKRPNYISKKDFSNVHFLFDTNRIPQICKKTLDKAQDLAFHGGNLNRITVCVLKNKMYIGDGQHRYLINNALGLRTLCEFIYVNSLEQIFQIMKSQNTNQNAWDNKQALKFFSGEGGSTTERLNYSRLQQLQTSYKVNFSNLWEIQAYYQYANKIRTIEDIRGYSQRVSRGFKDGNYRINTEMFENVKSFLNTFLDNKVDEVFYKNAKVLRCIMQLLVINKNKMRVNRLAKQLTRHRVNIHQEEVFIKTDIKKVYERNSNIKLLHVA